MSYRVKNWRQILSSSDSKRHLREYFVRAWERKQDLVGENKQLNVTQESKCVKITKEAVMKVHELACTRTREEADTRVILHASHAACSGFKSVVIVAGDTDILVLCIAFKKEINCNLYMLISSRN